MLTSRPYSHWSLLLTAVRARATSHVVKKTMLRGTLSSLVVTVSLLGTRTCVKLWGLSVTTSSLAMILLWRVLPEKVSHHTISRVLDNI